MKIGTIVTEVPQAEGGARPTRPEVTEIMEKAKLLGPDQWLVVEADNKKDVWAFVSSLRNYGHAAKQRGLVVYVGGAKSYVPRGTNGVAPTE